MYKELVICIVIIVSIFSLDMFTQGYTNRSVEEISKKIEEYISNNEKYRNLIYGGRS